MVAASRPDLASPGPPSVIGKRAALVRVHLRVPRYPSHIRHHEDPLACCARSSEKKLNTPTSPVPRSRAAALVAKLALPTASRITSDREVGQRHVDREPQMLVNLRLHVGHLPASEPRSIITAVLTIRNVPRGLHRCDAALVLERARDARLGMGS